MLIVYGLYTHIPLVEMSKAFDADQMDIMKLLYPAKQAIGYASDIYDLDREGRILDGQHFSYTGVQILKNLYLI